MLRTIVGLCFCLSFALSASAQKKAWTLRECIERAWAENLQVQQSQVQNQYNEINLRQNRLSQYPNVNASANQNFNFGRSINPYTYQFVNQNIQSNSFGLNASIVLFNGLQLRNQIKQGEINLQAGELDIETMRNDIALGVTAAYLQILFAQENVSNAASQIEATRAQLERTEKLVEAGRLVQGNLLQIQAQLASEKSNLVNAENQLNLARLNMVQFLELSPEESFMVERPDLENLEAAAGIMAGSVTVYYDALGRMPNIRSAKLRQQAAMYDYKIAKGGLYPRLSLTGSLGTGYSSASFLFGDPSFNLDTIGFVSNNPGEPVVTLIPEANQVNYPYFDQLADNFNQGIGLSLSIPIFNGYQVRSNMERAQLNIESARLSRKIAENNLRKDIEQAYVDAVAAEKRLEAAKELIQARERSFQDAQKRFDAGVITSAEFITEKNNLAQARSELAQARYDHAFKVKILEFYQGKDLDL